MAEGKKLDPVLEKALKVMSVNNGNVKTLETKELQMVIQHLCEISGLNWETSPFLIMENKKANTEKLYAGREACAQLAVVNKLTVIITERTITSDLAIFGARVSSPDGRSTDGTGCTSLEGQTGEYRSNKVMHAETKAKRRTILDHCGLGMLDESEVQTIDGVTTKEPPKPAQSTSTAAQTSIAQNADTANGAKASVPELPKQQETIATPSTTKVETPELPAPLSVKQSVPTTAQNAAQDSSAQPASVAYDANNPNPNYPGDKELNDFIKKANTVMDGKALNQLLNKNYGITWSTRYATVTKENLKLAHALIDQAIEAAKKS